MISHQRAVWGAWALSGFLVLLGARAWWTAIPSVPPPAPEARRPPGALAPLDTVSLAAARKTIQDRDPFCLEHKASGLRYVPWPSDSAAAASPAPKPPRPTLTLVGVLGGPPWNALVEGIPGRDGGVVLRVGEEASGIRLRAVHGDTVVLAGQDTTWMLTPRRVWP